jgi:hypothetical protein
LADLTRLGDAKADEVELLAAEAKATMKNFRK